MGLFHYLITSSFAEPPNKLFDYSFVGKPIITSVDGEIREIVEKNEIGFFAGTENPKGIAEAILRARQLKPEQLKKSLKMV